MLDYICDELIVEILTRLPPKSLLRFRSLSKLWYSLISSSGFIRTHSYRSPKKLFIEHRNFMTKGCDTEHFATLHSEDQLRFCPRCEYFGITTVKFPYKYFWIAGSCNGILCLLSSQNDIILWNPSIGRQLVVHDCPPRCSSWELTGFGFDPITEDYKIVSVSFPKENGENVESSFVYAMKTGAWCEIASPSSLFSKLKSKGCFVNGALHWVIKHHFTKLDDVDRSYILTFDLSTHVFGTIALPQASWKTTGITTIDGSLAVVSTKDDNSWIWVKRDASWSVVFKLKTNQVGGGITGVLQPRNNGDMLFCDWRGVYNPKTGAQSRLEDFDASSYIIDTEMYVESLHLLERESACESNHLHL